LPRPVHPRRGLVAHPRTPAAQHRRRPGQRSGKRASEQLTRRYFNRFRGGFAMSNTAKKDEARNYWAIEGVQRGGGLIKPVDGIVGPSPISQGLKVIDCDAHFTEPPDMWTSRAPAGMKSRMPHIRRVDGMDMWFCGDVNMGTL